MKFKFYNPPTTFPFPHTKKFIDQRRVTQSKRSISSLFSSLMYAFFSYFFDVKVSLLSSLIFRSFASRNLGATQNENKLLNHQVFLTFFSFCILFFVSRFLNCYILGFVVIRILIYSFRRSKCDS